MAPKKKEQQKMSLGTFLQDEKLGSWADEMEDVPVYSRSGYGNQQRSYTSTSASYGGTNAGGYSVREELPLPDKPPYTVHLGNLSFDATNGDVTDFFTGCQVTNVRIIEDKLEMKPKGFGYAEFATRDGLIKALELNGSQFQGRNIRISVADPPKDRDRPDAREFGDWTRKGPLQDLPGRGTGDRRVSDRGFGAGRGFGDSGSDPHHDRRDRREAFPNDEGKIRDFGNWERRGPLSPLPQQERQTSSRDGGRPRTNDGPRSESFKDRKSSPAAWGEGRAQGSQDGSRPPRREFQDRPVIERAPTAAEQDNQWRNKMKPDAPVKSQTPSRDGSEAPPSPAVAPPSNSRPKLNLAKRTVSEAVDLQSPASASASGDSKANPFGGARPIDTAAKEKEIEEKRLLVIREKKEADDKAREEKRLAKEAAKADKQPTTESSIENEEVSVENKKKIESPGPDQETMKNGDFNDTDDANGTIGKDKAPRSSEVSRDSKSRPADSGAWRRASGGPKPPKNDSPRGTRGDGPRGDGPPRGPRGDGLRNEGSRGQRSNGGNQNTTASAASGPTDAEPRIVEEDGWSTVSKPKKNLRGGNQSGRPIPS